MTDTAQERVEHVLSSEKVEQIRGYWRDWYPTTPHAVSGCDCQECRTWKDIIDLCDSHERLRARQREEGEGDEWNELLSRAVELRQSDSASKEEVRDRAEKLTRDILAAEEAGQFAGEDDRLVPEACPHCSGLMGHYGDCPHGPQQEREREQ